MEVGQVQVQVHLDQVGQDLVLKMITHVSVLMGTLVIDVKQVNMLSQYTLIAVLFFKVDFLDHSILFISSVQHSIAILFFMTYMQVLHIVYHGY